MSTKDKYPYTMVIYLATMEFNAKNSYAKGTDFSFEALEVRYKKAADALHLEYQVKLPCSIRKIEKPCLNAKDVMREMSTNGCIPASRIFYFFLAFDKASDELEAHSRSVIAEAIDRVIWEENHNAHYELIHHRNNARYAIESKTALLSGLTGSKPLPLYDRKAFLYSISTEWSSRDPRLRVEEARYYVSHRDCLVIDPSYCRSHNFVRRLCDIGENSWEYNGSIWLLEHERNDLAAISKLIEGATKHMEWQMRHVKEWKRAIKHASKKTTKIKVW